MKIGMLRPHLLIKGMCYCLISFSFVFHALAADEYWRWKDEKGVVHYGTAPPLGVEAERVTNYGNAEFAKQAEDDADTPPMSDALIELRKKRCSEENQRLAHFSRSSLIRMKMPDGTTKTMSKEEIEHEKSISQKIIDDNCDTPAP